MDDITKKIIDNNREIEKARKILDVMKTEGFKEYLVWLEEHHKTWENVPVHMVKDIEHLNKLKGGVMYGYELNAQLSYWENKAKEEIVETPSSQKRNL
jgi:hypothetical protein